MRSTSNSTGVSARYQRDQRAGEGDARGSSRPRITIGELTRVVTRLPDGQRRDRISRWIEEDLLQQFNGRMLTFDLQTAVILGKILGAGDREGRPRAAADAQIAATAIQHRLTLVTRNMTDFHGMGVQLLNPWGAP